MEKLLARLERRFGRFAVENLAYVIVGGMAAVFVLSQLNPEFVRLLILDPERVVHGEVWRLFTYVFIPRDFSLLFVFFSLYWMYLIGRALEAEWGAFKFNLFYLIGMASISIAAFVTGVPMGSFWLHASLGLAFATVFPDYEILFMFVLPVRMKWVGALGAVSMGYAFAQGGLGERATIIASVLNYLLFFGPQLLGATRAQSASAIRRQTFQRTSLKPPAVAVYRACAICGASQADGADIRVCNCEKCGHTPRNLCLEHARNH